MNKKKTTNFLVIFMLVGCAALLWGIFGQIGINEKIKDYILIKGTVVEVKEVMRTNQHGDTKVSYIPTIKYIVKNNEYMVRPSNTFMTKPEVGEQRKIKYNPNNPSEAIVESINGYNASIGIGYVFIAIPLLYFSLATTFMEVAASALLGGVGYFLIYFCYIEVGEWDFSRMFGRLGIIMLIAVFFIGLAIYTLFLKFMRILPGSKPNLIKIKLEKIVDNGNGRNTLIFINENKNLNWDKYAYETESLNLFVEGSLYEVDMSRIVLRNRIRVLGEERFVTDLRRLKEEDFKKIDNESIKEGRVAESSYIR